jgi:predicted Fe-Mo cluster-binding NifX family protein
MKIGVPTNDGTSISEHFGRSAAFLIYAAEDGKITGCEVKRNGMEHAHERGACDHNSPAHEPHSHASIISSLAGCEVVICAGMGQGAAEALKAGGVKQILVTDPGPAEQIVTAYLSGNIRPRTTGFCGCRHHSD